MALKNYKAITPSLRQLITVDRSELWKGSPLKILTNSSSSNGGRNNMGHITVRHQGGGHKQSFRVIDFKRDKYDIEAVVERIEYDPNRTAFIALLKYLDGIYLLHNTSNIQAHNLNLKTLMGIPQMMQ